jgi:predicted  nucleic acid-binding Zn-ribbon protein
MTDSDESLMLENLIRLQELELDLTSLKERVERTPAEIEQLDSEIEDDQRQVEEAKEAIEESGKIRRQLEAEVEALRDKLTHYQDQLMQVKTNTEYQAMLHEIQFAKERIETKEDEILSQMMDADEKERVLVEKSGDYGKKEAAIRSRKQELEQFLKQSETELNSLEEQVDQIKSLLSREHLARYKRIAAVRNGIALAAVVGGTCQGCHVRLRPQLLAEVKLNRQVRVCENCSRILYFPSS